MPVFFGFISDKQSVLETEIKVSDVVRQQDRFIDDEIEVNTNGLYGRFFRHTTKKFEKEKVFFQNESVVYILDGIVLNKNKLFKEYQLDQNENMASLLERMRKTVPENFFNEFRGSFSGGFLDKDQSIFTLYTNHIGDKEIFYYLDKEKNTLYFSTDFENLVNLAHIHSGMKFKLNSNAAYSLMTHGHTLCNDTLFEEVYRLTPGHYISYSGTKFEKKEYFHLKNDPIPIGEDEALQKIDTYFRNAIKMAFEKDLEYGYKHLVALSGGLDSRMTAWVAYEMGYTTMLNYTFSQSDYLDEKIPKQITNYLKTEWIFKSLDNGTYLYNYFEESVRISGARSQSSTVAHTLSMLNNLNMENFGLVHTGQLGDVIIGTYYDEGKKQPFKPGAGVVSNKLLSNVHYSEANSVEIKDQELFKFYNRGFTGVNVGLKPMYEYTETVSPFLDIDFLEFCLSLPLEYRSGHSIYIKWINQFYPGAADFIYEKVNGKINKKTITVKGIPVPWTSIPAAARKIIKKKLGLKLTSKNHMNPMDYWYKTNVELRNFYFMQFQENIDFVKDKTLKKDCQELFEKGSALEKDQVITLLNFLREMKELSH
ncbi:hypothetical protein [Carnobacterium maltaromaticum]|uniref:hypothetical protein n=1 Tax=Carnobacterium maltaromaticum TaxID=2751 RepID=UPI0012F7CF0C|nr:hypothetical protein [Carnobacterium maltaromaticum]